LVKKKGRVAAGYNSIDIDVNNLAAGTYSVSVMTANDRSRVLRFVKK